MSEFTQALFLLHYFQSGALREVAQQNPLYFQSGALREVAQQNPKYFQSGALSSKTESPLPESQKKLNFFELFYIFKR
jgi:hypothetical protein